MYPSSSDTSLSFKLYIYNIYFSLKINTNEEIIKINIEKIIVSYENIVNIILL